MTQRESASPFPAAASSAGGPSLPPAGPATSPRCRGKRWLLAGALACSLLLPPAALAESAVEQFQFAEGLFIRQDYESALEEYRSVVAEHAAEESAPAARYRIGECLLRLGRNKEAAAAYDAALQAAPKAPEAPLGRYNLGCARLALGEHEAAATAFAEAAASGEAQVREEALVAQAESLIKAEKLDAAVPVYEAFLKAFPESKHRDDALFSLGWIHGVQGRFEPAAATLTAHRAAFPKSSHAAAATLALSDALVTLERYDDATALLKELQADPAHAEEAGLRLAWAEFKRGRKKEAAAAFLAFAEAYPKAALRPAALYNAGISLVDTGDYAAAVPVFERLRREHAESPEAGDAIFWLATAYSETAKPKALLDLLAPLLAKDVLPAAQAPTAWYMVAQARQATEDRPGAMAAYAQLAKAYPDATNRPNALYALATLQAAAGDLKAAVATLADLVAAYPQHAIRPHALFALGEYRYQLKDLEGAEAPLAELAKATDAEPKTLYRLGRVQYERERFADARASFERLAKLDSEFRDEAAFMAARSAEAAKDLPAAIAAYRALPTPKTADAWAEQAYYRLAFLLEPAEAQANLAAYTARFPKGQHRAVMHLRLAERRFADGQLEAAEKDYAAAQAADPTPEMARSAAYGQGWCLLKLQKAEDAAKAFARVGEAPLDNAMVRDALLQRGEIAYSREAYPEAAALFKRLEAGDDAAAERALYMLGWNARREGKLADSVAPFSALLKRFPQGRYPVDAAIRVADAQLQAGDPAAARASLEAIRPAAGAPDPLAASPLAEEYRQLHADVLVRLKDWKAVIDVCKAMRQANPESKQAYLTAFRLGLAYQALGLLDDAEAEFKATIAATNTEEAAQAQFNIGSLYYSRKAYAEAAKQFLRVDVTYNYPAISPKALYHAIEAFMQGGETYRKRAEGYARDLEKNYPDSNWTRKAKALLNGDKAAQND